jgi:4'-phosphopantetheinyl transferase EntD
VAVVAVTDLTADLYPEEAARLEPMVARRRATFSSGRAAARMALVAAGAEAGPIGQRGTAPDPPLGWTLSISHTDHWAVAIAARADDVAGLGVDIEQVERMKPAYARFIALGHDRLGDDPCTETLTRAFALREAVFKALDGSGQGALGRIDLTLSKDGLVEARPFPDQPGRMDSRTATVGAHVLAVCLRWDA